MTWRHKQKIPYKNYLVILNIQRISFENISTWQKHLSVFWSDFPCQYAIVEHTKKTFINVHNMKIDCIFNDYLSLKNIIKLTILNRNSSVIRQKGESQNWCFKETKHAKFSEKRTFVTPWCARTYQGVRNVRFSENLACFVFLKHPFWDSPFCLITDEFYASKISFENFLTHAWSMFPFYKPKNTRWDLVFWCFQVE